MRIVVCVKQVIDVTFPIGLDLDTYRPFEEDIFYIVNPADRCASELALRVKEKWGGEVIFVAFGPPRVQSALRSCLAMGGDKAIHVWGQHLEAGFDATAHILARIIKVLAPDLIFCGNQSLDERCAEIPAVLAELLDFPQVTGVLTLELFSDRAKVIVQRKLERGRRQSLECPLPAVFAVEPEAVQPRYAPLPQLLQAYSAEISQIDSKELELDLSRLKAISSQRRLVRLSSPRPKPKKTFAYDTSLPADQRMDLLMSGGLKQKQGNLWEGEPQDLAKRLAEILTARAWQ